MKFVKAKILGSGAYFPKKIVTNFDLEKLIDTSHEWILERTGIIERRISSDLEEESTTELAKFAALEAIERSGLDKEEIDLIIFATYTPDLLLPNAASILQKKLGITNGKGAVDLGAACSGFLYALNFANSLIQTGTVNNVLIVGAEVLSKKVNWKDRETCILFGDGAGAIVLGRNLNEQDPSEVLACEFGADGSGTDLLLQKYGGTLHPITTEVLNNSQQFLSMNGKEIFKFAVRTLVDISQHTLAKCVPPVKVNEIDWFIPHQANLRIIEACAKRLEVSPDKIILNLQKFANTSAATIPTAIHQSIMEEKLLRGHKVLMAAFGAGVTSAATLLIY